VAGALGDGAALPRAKAFETGQSGSADERGSRGVGRCRYLRAVTASASPHHVPADRSLADRSCAEDASPAAIRAALLSEDRERFDEAYRRALGLLMLTVLHFIPATDRPQQLVTAYRQVMAPVAFW